LRYPGRIGDQIETPSLDYWNHLASHAGGIEFDAFARCRSQKDAACDFSDGSHRFFQLKAKADGIDSFLRQLYYSGYDVGFLPELRMLFLLL
jgi:hypothetical protein